MRAFAMISMAGLSACVSGARPMALAESGPVAVELAGRSYIADLQPSESGAVLAMTRDGAGFGNFEGAEAKRAAEAFCASRGASVNRAAYGHYAGGAWLFKGSCA
ncbi:hypothetical protein [Cypionkella psychrotolerans]|uniref:hypothetical protein n=1 Tax=Cypionkella psychrotolerans TaxID=1678131 RepID=UPI0006B5AB52|nr:hypothetical protein [Cypionkella psychrotolerans]